MKMDMRNYTLQSRQPHLREHSIQRERAQFQERLSRQPGAGGQAGGSGPRLPGRPASTLPPSRSPSVFLSVCVGVGVGAGAVI